MYRRMGTAALILVLLMSAWASAAEVSGELQVGTVYELEEAITELPIRLKLALEDNPIGNGKFYLSLKGLFDPLSGESEQFRLNLMSYMAVYLDDGSHSGPACYQLGHR